MSAATAAFLGSGRRVRATVAPPTTVNRACAADTIVVVERQTQGTVFDVRGRDVEADTLAVEFNKNTCRWTILGSAETLHRSTERARILAVFRETREPMTAKDVTEALACDTPPRHMSQVAARQLLARMAKDGDLEKPERGKYSLPTGGESHGHKVTTEKPNVTL